MLGCGVDGQDKGMVWRSRCGCRVELKCMDVDGV